MTFLATLILVLMMLIGPLAVDVTCTETTRARLQSTLDRVRLAAADARRCSWPQLVWDNAGATFMGHAGSDGTG